MREKEAQEAEDKAQEAEDKVQEAKAREADAREADARETKDKARIAKLEEKLATFVLIRNVICLFLCLWFSVYISCVEIPVFRVRCSVSHG